MLLIKRLVLLVTTSLFISSFLLVTSCDRKTTTFKGNIARIPVIARAAPNEANSIPQQGSAIGKIANKLEIRPETTTIPNGMTQKFVAVASFSDGTILDVTVDTKWSLENPEIGAFGADKSNFGVFTAKNIGSALAVANYSQLSAKAEIIVTDAQLIAINIEPFIAETFIGETVVFKAKGIFSDKEERDITKDVNWKSDGDAASISNIGDLKGSVAALKVGKILVIATRDLQIATAQLEVKNPGIPSVDLKINSSDIGLTIARNLVTHISWSSSGATLCELKKNGALFDNRKEGAADVSISADTIFAIECKNAIAVSAKDEVTVKVTDPTLELLVNSSKNLITVSKGGIVTLQWKSQNVSECLLKENGVQFSVLKEGVVQKPVNQATSYFMSCKDVAGTVVSQSVQVDINQSGSVVTEAGGADTAPGTTVNRPLAIYFALDITGSMAGQISTVKDNIVSFVENLRSKNFQPSLGLIPFRDDIGTIYGGGDVPEGRFNLNSNVDAFKNFVSTLSASGGADANEAALIAVEASLEDILAKETRPDALKAILAITDFPGHRGGTHDDCSTSTTVARFNAIPESQKNLVKFFYSGADNLSYCMEYNTTAKAQFDELLSRIIPSVPLASRGGYVPWPFTASDLVDKFTNMLQSVSPPIDLVCLNKSAKITRRGVVMAEWNNIDLISGYQSFIARTPQSFSRIFTQAEKDALTLDPGVLEVQRCCVSSASAKAYDFSSCLKSVTVPSQPFTVNFL